MYDNQQNYNGHLFYQEQPQANLPREQQFGGGIQQQAITQAQPVQQPQQQATLVQQPTGIQLITEQQAQQIIETIRPTPISNPVKIDRPAYLVTEEQMKYMLSLAEGNPLQVPQSQPFVASNQIQQVQKVSQLPLLPSSSTRNSIDTLGEMTLGTVSRLGHTFTGLVNSVVDVLTLGYGKQNHR